MRAWQESGFGNNLANRLGITPVNPLAGFQDRPTDDISFFALDQAADQHPDIRITKLFLCRAAHFAKRCLTL